MQVNKNLSQTVNSRHFGWISFDKNKLEVRRYWNLESYFTWYTEKTIHDTSNWFWGWLTCKWVFRSHGNHGQSQIRAWEIRVYFNIHVHVGKYFKCAWTLQHVYNQTASGYPKIQSHVEHNSVEFCGVHHAGLFVQQPKVDSL